MEETKIIYYVDDEETPYLIKFHTSHDQITLGDFKSALNKPNYKFFFKSVDDDFGVVKEEITDDDCKLPCVDGKVVSWLVVADGSTQSDNHSSSGKEIMGSGDGGDNNGRERGTVSDSSDPKSPIMRNSSRSNNKTVKKQDENKKHKSKYKFTGPEKINLDETDDAFDEIDSIYNADKVPPLRKFSDYKHTTKLKKIRSNSSGGSTNNNSVINNNSNNGNNYNTNKNSQPIYESSSSMMSSDIDTTSFFDSEDESSRFSSATETTMSSKYGRQRRQLRRRRKMPHLSRASSFSSMTDSTVSLNIITVTLNMDSVPFLGISIVGQTNGCQENGDGGIYVGSIMKGGAVALDGRIEPGDMILEVNGISFESVSNEEAVRALREQVQRPGPVTLVVAKSWDPPILPVTGGGQLNMQPQPQQPHQSLEPVRPIDPHAWVVHTAMATDPNPPPPPPIPGNTGTPYMGPYPPPGVALSTAAASTLTTTSSSLRSSSLVDGAPNNGGISIGPPDPGATSLTSTMDPAVIVRAMAQPDSGLLIRDRLWLKITIYNAFIGSDLVDWLYSRVHGFSDRKEARKFAANLLKLGHIRHTVNKSTFSEQCYYVLNELHTAFSSLNLDSEIDSVSVVAGQQAAKSRMMQHHELSANKDSPVLSSGFQSGCSNKWSAYHSQQPPIQDLQHHHALNASNLSYNLYQNNYNHQPFYPDTMQSQTQQANMKTISNLSHGLSVNMNSGRPTGSVHSGSVVAKNCVCLQSIGVMKAVKHLWDGGSGNSKPLPVTTNCNEVGDDNIGPPTNWCPSIPAHASITDCCNKDVITGNQSSGDSGSSNKSNSLIANINQCRAGSDLQKHDSNRTNKDEENGINNNSSSSNNENPLLYQPHVSNIATSNNSFRNTNAYSVAIPPGSSASGSSNNNMITRTIAMTTMGGGQLQQQQQPQSAVVYDLNTSGSGANVQVPTITMLPPGINSDISTSSPSNNNNLQQQQIHNIISSQFNNNGSNEISNNQISVKNHNNTNQLSTVTNENSSSGFFSDLVDKND